MIPAGTVCLKHKKTTFFFQKEKTRELSLPVEPQPPDMCSALLCVLCHILNKLKVQVEGRSTAARGQRRVPGCEQSSLYEAAGPLHTALRPHTHTYTHIHTAHIALPSGLLGNQSHLRLGQIHDAY